MEEYILIISQEANFQSRSILVPKKEFLEDENMRKEYEILIECVREFQESLEKHLTNEKLASLRNIKGLLIQNIVWERNEKGRKTIGHHEETPFSSIVGHIMFLIQDSWDSDIGSIAERKWLDKSITNFCSGFNHINNYLNVLEKGVNYNGLCIKPEQIVDSFLILEANDGEVNLPPVDTVEEMYERYYQ